jgi:hypothetical protein
MDVEIYLNADQNGKQCGHYLDFFANTNTYMVLDFEINLDMQSTVSVSE